MKGGKKSSLEIKRSSEQSVRRSLTYVLAPSQLGSFKTGVRASIGAYFTAHVAYSRVYLA